jgi:hypothetical protein
MEIRNTATDTDLNWLDTPELLSQLNIALRSVAGHEGLPTYASDTMCGGLG